MNTCFICNQNYPASSVIMLPCSHTFCQTCYSLIRQYKEKHQHVAQNIFQQPSAPQMSRNHAHPFFRPHQLSHISSYSGRQSESPTRSQSPPSKSSTFRGVENRKQKEEEYGKLNQGVNAILNNSEQYKVIKGICPVCDIHRDFSQPKGSQFKIRGRSQQQLGKKSFDVGLSNKRFWMQQQNAIPFTTKNSNLTTQPGSPLSFQNWKHFFPKNYRKSSEYVRSSSPVKINQLQDFAKQKGSKSFTISLVPTLSQNNDIVNQQDKQQDQEEFQNKNDLTFQSNNNANNNCNNNNNNISFTYDSTNTTTISALRPLSHNIGLINQNKIDQHIMSSKSLLGIKQNKRYYDSGSKKDEKYTTSTFSDQFQSKSLKFSTNPKIRNSFQEFNDQLVKILQPINDGFELQLNTQQSSKTLAGISSSLLNSHICPAHDQQYQYYCNDKFLCKKCIRLLRGSNLLFGEKIYTISQVAEQFQQRLKNEKHKMKKITIQDYCLKLESTQTFLKQWYKKSRVYINQQFSILQQLIKLQKTKVLSQIQSTAQQQTALLRHHGNYLKDITQFIENAKSPCLMSSPFSIEDQHKLSNLFANFTQKLAIFRAKFHSVLDQACMVKSDLTHFDEVTKVIGKISLRTKEEIVQALSQQSRSSSSIEEKQNYKSRNQSKKGRRHIRIQSRYTASNNQNYQNCTDSSTSSRHSDIKMQEPQKPHLANIANKTPSPHNFFAIRMQKMNQKWQRTSSTTRSGSTALPKTPQTGKIQTLSSRNQNIPKLNNQFKTPQPFFQSFNNSSGNNNNAYNNKNYQNLQQSSPFNPQDNLKSSKIINGAYNDLSIQHSRQPTFEDQKIYTHTRQSSKSFNSSDKLAALLFPNNSNTNPPSSRKQSISAYDSISLLSNHQNNKFASNASQQYEKSISPNLFNVSIAYPDNIIKKQNLTRRNIDKEIIDLFSINHMSDDDQNIVFQSNNSDSSSSQLFENPSLYFSPQVAPGSHIRKSTFGEQTSGDRKNRLKNFFDSKSAQTGNFGDNAYNSLVKSAASKYTSPMNMLYREQNSKPCNTSLFALNDGSFQETGKFNSRNISKHEGFPTFTDEDQLIKSQKRDLNKRSLFMRDKQNNTDQKIMNKSLAF